MIKLIRNTFSYKWAILWASLIFVLCAIPGRDLPHSDWLEILQFDKWVHAGMFFILFLLSGKAYRTLNAEFGTRERLILFVICAGYGAFLEVMQDLVFIDRSFDIYDEIANSFGALMGFLFFRRVLSLLKSSK